jgi:hypothetical protein
MDKNSLKENPMEEKIRIDYDNIDVADLMAQIKAEIAQRPKPTLQEQLREERYEQSPPPSGGGGEGSAAPRSKIKRILLKIMRPFSPVIKFLVLPVHEELRQTIVSLDRTNRRLDFLCATMEEELRKLGVSIGNGLEETNKRVDNAFLKLSKSGDYTKLLHNLSHNIVVELTKLKIEEETLKSKTRLMEKDFEFLRQREKALEKQVLK